MQGSQSGIVFVVYLIFFVGIMYFMIFLPQKKRDKKTRQMLESLQVGATVTTIGGMIGKIINIKDDEVTIETSVERTQVNIKKWAVKEIEKPIET